MSGIPNPGSGAAAAARVLGVNLQVATPDALPGAMGHPPAAAAPPPPDPAAKGKRPKKKDDEDEKDGVRTPLEASAETPEQTRQAPSRPVPL
jgi:hypothetical protein